MKAIGDIYIGAVFSTKGYGDVEVIDNKGWLEVVVKFLDTGTIKSVRSINLRDGKLKDPFKPTVCGKGYLGEGKHKPYSNGIRSKSYASWKNMLRRCYDPKFHSARPTYKDCTVCDEWLNFQVFADWFDENHKDGLDLDKDMISEGNRVYSPQACQFVSSFDNCEHSHAKRFSFVSPDGEITEVHNLNKFSRENSLDAGSMSRVASGKYKHHRGWTAHLSTQSPEEEGDD